MGSIAFYDDSLVESPGFDPSAIPEKVGIQYFQYVLDAETEEHMPLRFSGNIQKPEPHGVSCFRNGNRENWRVFETANIN
jgi:hypothetical protein